ncbi:uncharacterized protein LOC121757084 [Salvia splendens]|uniref:uncharacterized protein LOC121757084 n=1 Tax=Salvia splendens TaxID=180675 RepID=UPI001C264039|nr:uncharacterized protein LOC121757084 [Salvia splendens]
MGSLALITTLLILSVIGGGSAVEYSVTNTAENTPGGTKFNNVIGAEYSQQTLAAASDFIWGIFQQTNPADRKSFDRVSLFIDVFDEVEFKDAPAYASNNEIHVSARHINDFPGDVKVEFTGILYHEMTHVWQWNGNGNRDEQLLYLNEGIADFVRLKAGYPAPGWEGPGKGDRWDEGYSVTARFLEYCDGLKSGFVAELNKKLRDSYSPNFFQDLLGKSVDTLWAEYKATYAN